MQFLFSCIDLVKNSVSLYTHEFFLFLNSSFSSSVFRFHYLQYPFSSLLNTAPFFVMLFMPLIYLSSVSDIPDLGLGMYSWSNSVESQRAFFFILGFYLDSLFADSVHAHYYLDPSLLRGNLLFNSWTSENASIDLGAILRSSSTDNSGIGMHVPTFQALLSTGAILNPSLVPFSIEYTSIHSFFDSWGLSGSISLFSFGQHVQSGNTETVGLDSFFASEYLYPIVTDGRYEWTHCIPWTGTPPDFGYRYIDYIRLIDGRPIMYNGRVQYETQPGILELDLFYGYLDNREAFTLYGVNPLYQEIDFIGVIPAWYENANLNLSGAYLFMDKNYLFTSADAATAWQMNFQDPATPVMEGLINLHHDLVFFLVLVITFVFWMLSRTVWHFHHTKNPIPSKTIHLAILEIVWTTIPALILVVIAIPSFSLLYATDEVIDPAITIKAVGHQWYWSYEYTDYETKSGSPINFDSVMVLEDDLEVGQLRLLEVDNRIVLPANTHIRIVVTSADVIHSWCVPSLGVKLDACPGRLNEVPIFIKREGVYYGQCSEICGVNHGFMPIVVQAVSYDDYLVWLSNHDV